MNRWITYLNERSPLPALLFLSAGIGFSSMIITGMTSWPLLAACLVLNTLVFIQMRLGDELKDFETDKIINPKRPLPRGLLQTSEVFRALVGLLIFLILAGVCMGALGSRVAGLAFILTTIFAWLMFKEFYIGKGLAKSPMVYALTHQVIVFPLFGWFAVLLREDILQSNLFLGWMVANFGCSFTFEICRKLDPKADKLAGTYAHHYGRPLTLFFTSIFIAFTVVGACAAGFLWGTIPAVALLFSLLAWLKKPESYKVPALLSALSSAVVLWAPCLHWLVQRWL